MPKIAVSPLVFVRLERLATFGKFAHGSCTLLEDGRWELSIDDEVMEELQLVHPDPERALRILLNLPGGRDN